MRKVFLIAISMVFIVSCKTTHDIKSVNQPKISTPSLKKQNINTLVAKIKANQFNYKWITAHFSVEMERDSAHDSFSGDIRMRKDSVIWMSIRVLLGTIEGVRIMTTQDSAMYINRSDNTYFKGDYDYINSRLNTADDLDFDLLQSVMTGSSMEFYNDTAKMKSYYDGSQYIISTIRKRKLKKIIYKNRSYHSKDDAQFIFLDPQDFKVTHVRVEDFINKRTFDAYYSDFQKVDSVLFPFHVECQITAKKNIKIDLQYKKVSFKDREEVPFTIPKKYQRVQY